MTQKSRGFLVYSVLIFGLLSANAEESFRPIKLMGAFAAIINPKTASVVEARNEVRESELVIGVTVNYELIPSTCFASPLAK